MVLGASRRVAAALLATLIGAACSGSPSAPAAPTPTPPQIPSAVRAAIDITSISVSSERAAGGGYRYRLVLDLRETAGVAARVDGVDLTFTKGGETLATSRHDQPLANGTTVAARGTAATRELVTTDANAAHASATSVTARVAFSDATDAPSSATASTDVPAPSDAAAALFTLTGKITDQSSGGGIAGARVEALNGVNAGKATTTDATGAYMLASLTEDGFRMRASANGFDAGEQNVTVPVISRADMALRRTATAPPSGPCAYTATPTAILGVPFTGGQGTITIAQTTGTCGWQAASDATWLTLSAGAGSGSGTLLFTAAPNGSFNGRTATVTITWAGGRAQVTVIQGTPPDFCQMELVDPNGQSTISIAAGGSSGTIAAFVRMAFGVNPAMCGIFSITSRTASPGISIGSVPPGTSLAVPFTVSPNTTGAPRSLSVQATVQFSGIMSGTLTPRLIVNQSP